MLAACCAGLTAQIPLNTGASEPAPLPAVPTEPASTPGARESVTVTGARALLGAGDLLDISILDVPDMTQRVRVDGDGAVHLALIGDIVVSGKTSDWLRKEIEGKLIAGHYVRHPQANVFVFEYAGQLVSVTGEVYRPGSYALLRAHRLADVVAAAGGTTPRAGHMATIIRNGDTKNAIRVDLNQQDSNLGNPELQPGDVVNIGLTGIVYVLGSVGRPGGFLLDRRTSVTFMQALALAEGPTQTASLTKAVIIHSHDSNPQPEIVNLKEIVKGKGVDVVLRDGDIVWVGDSQFRNLGRLALQTVIATATEVAIYSGFIN